MDIFNWKLDYNAQVGRYPCTKGSSCSNYVRSVNFGFASLISATISMYYENFVLNAWQLLLVFYATLILTFCIVAFCNRWLPYVDTFCAGWTAVSIIIIMIALSVKADAGRHSAAYALGHYDTSFSGNRYSEDIQVSC
jgi:hypothetical protein